MVNKNQHDLDKEKFSMLLSKFTGINKKELTEYFKENPVNMIFEHPDSIKMNEKQQEKVKSLMELKGLYKNLKENPDRYVMNSPFKVGDYFSNYYPDLKDREYVACSYLDAKLQVIKTEIIDEGSISQANLSTREVAKRALNYDASAIMVSHNHPSGNPNPSTADIRTTQNLQNGLKSLDIRLLDHVIVGDSGSYVSLNEQGYINEDKEVYSSEKSIEGSKRKLHAQRMMQSER